MRAPRSPLSLVAATATVTGGLTAAGPALAAGATVTIEIPRLPDQPYRKPYVAVWLEDAAGKQVKMISVFHDQARIGARWLPDLRTWWRVGGRAMTMPTDGISRPTQAPGRHTVSASLTGLAPGRYTVVVEAAREKGGRELVKVPFEWRAGRRAAATARGTSELGAVAVSVQP